MLKSSPTRSAVKTSSTVCSRDTVLSISTRVGTGRRGRAKREGRRELSTSASTSISPRSTPRSVALAELAAQLGVRHDALLAGREEVAVGHGPEERLERRDRGRRRRLADALLEPPRPRGGLLRLEHASREELARPHVELGDER